MARIKAFKGYRYNKDKIESENLGVVMTTPYDTISDDEQMAYYEQNPYNIIRISKGIQKSDDTDADNCYKRASTFLNEWIKKGILEKEEKEAIYLYEQRVKYHDTTFVNHGVVSLLELTEFEEKEVVPCELPTVSTARDRYNLLSEINANVDMINCMYIDPEKTLTSLINEMSDTEPDITFTTDERVIENETEHRIWVINDEKTIEFIKESLKNKTFFITDGHNRYVTALKYREYCKENDPEYSENSGCNYIMSVCTNAYGNRMVQLPVHRMLKKEKRFNEDFFVACAQDHFKIEKIIVDTTNDTIIDTMKKQIHTMRMENKFALYCGGNYFYRLTFTDKEFIKTVMPDKSEAYRGLDVVVFNKLILEDILNISEEDIDKYITYTKRATKGVNAIKEKEASCLFVLNPIKAEQIREVALSGEIMPDRAIYIFPKPATGVIIHKFE